jgi:hypothetical protein
MKHDMSNQQLSHLLQDIDFQNKHSPSFSFFNQEKIRRFYQQNNFRIEALTKCMQQLVTKYVKKDEKGKPVIITNDKNQSVYDFESDEIKQKYLDEYNEFMAKHVEVIS